MAGRLPGNYHMTESGSEIDHAFMTGHSQWLVENGCTGVVVLGSLGEARRWTSTKKLR